jgi:hypothetical protein
MKKKSISLLCVMLILCAGVNFTRAQTTKKKSVFDKIFNPTPTATPSTTNDTTSTTASDDKKTDKIVSGKLSVKDDEFTGKRTVALDDLALAEDLTVSLKTEVDLKTVTGSQTRAGQPRPDDMFRRSIADTVVTFVVSHSENRHLFMNENNRVDFMVDGERVAGNFAKSSIYSSVSAGKEEVLTVLNLDRLGKVVRGKDVKMKLGEKVYVIDSSVKDRLKEFLKALGR